MRKRNASPSSSGGEPAVKVSKPLTEKAFGSMLDELHLRCTKEK